MLFLFDKKNLQICYKKIQKIPKEQPFLLWQWHRQRLNGSASCQENARLVMFTACHHGMPCMGPM